VRTGQQLFFHPEEYFAGLIEDIDNAQTRIALEMYIFELDKVGNRVLAALERAAARQVRLQVLIDGVGSYRDANAIATRLDTAQCELRVFHPLPWDFALYRRALGAGRGISRILYFLASVNHRDHRKLCIIDGKTAWLGSYNITDDHFDLHSTRADDYWHDTGLRVTGPVVNRLATNFSEVWERKTGNLRKRSLYFLSGDEVRRRRQRKLQLVQVLALARQRVWITNAYFNPTYRVLRALKTCASNGVSVKLIVPARSDVVFFPLLARSYYSDLLQAGIQVYEYDKRVLHSKTMVIDDQALVGSTNLNYRSLFHDQELDLLIDDGDIVSRLQSRFEQDIEDCREITLLRNPRRHPLLIRPLGWLARFLRYWL
jgi:cardiolipin synthase